MTSIALVIIFAAIIGYAREVMKDEQYADNEDETGE